MTDSLKHCKFLETLQVSWNTAISLKHCYFPETLLVYCIFYVGIVAVYCSAETLLFPWNTAISLKNCYFPETLQFHWNSVAALKFETTYVCFRVTIYQFDMIVLAHNAFQYIFRFCIRFLGLHNPSPLNSPRFAVNDQFMVTQPWSAFEFAVYFFSQWLANTLDWRAPDR